MYCGVVVIFHRVLKCLFQAVKVDFSAPKVIKKLLLLYYFFSSVGEIPGGAFELRGIHARCQTS
jgi:hypothetical protein